MASFKPPTRADTIDVVRLRAGESLPVEVLMKKLSQASSSGSGGRAATFGGRSSGGSLKRKISDPGDVPLVKRVSSKAEKAGSERAVSSRATSRSNSLVRNVSLTRSSSSKSKAGGILEGDSQASATVDQLTRAPSQRAGPSQPEPVDAPGQRQIEVVISFDTTGSMSMCIDEVKGQITYVLERLFMDIPNLKIGIIAHGDYCDENVFYLLKSIPFTNNIAELVDFVKEVEGTGGGDMEECYEYVLNYIRTSMPWSRNSQKAVVMIGDAMPHTLEQLKQQKRKSLDWREESLSLWRDMDVHFYGVQCLNNREAAGFWNEIAMITKGRHLSLADFTSIVNTIMAICYMENSPDYVRDDVPQLPAHHDHFAPLLRGPSARTPAGLFGSARAQPSIKIQKSISKKMIPLPLPPPVPRPGPSKGKAVAAGPAAKKPKVVQKQAVKAQKVKAATMKAPKVKVAVKAPKVKAAVVKVAAAKAAIVPKVKAATVKAPKAATKKRAAPKQRKPAKKAKKSAKERKMEKMKQFMKKERVRLGALKWSRWISVTSGENKDLNKAYVKTHGFKNTDKPCVFELGIKRKGCKRVKAVFAAATIGLKRGTWKKFLIHGKIENELKNYLSLQNSADIVVVRMAKLGEDTMRKFGCQKPSKIQFILNRVKKYPWNRSRGQKQIINFP